jgi:hypothetical protein
MGEEKKLTGGGKGGVLRVAIPGGWSLSATAVTRLAGAGDDTSVCIEIEREADEGRVVMVAYLEPREASRFARMVDEAVDVAMQRIDATWHDDPEAERLENERAELLIAVGQLDELVASLRNRRSGNPPSINDHEVQLLDNLAKALREHFGSYGEG